MVFGWLAALAMETVSHTMGESTITYGTREFNRFLMAYDFAIEGQKLKREDVRDLVELIVSRMDMYHLVGALLLQFCVSFYGELKLLEEDYVDEPCFVLEMFLLSNICAIGFLLFAVWLSLHASVAAHAIGVEFQLDSNRLTVPSPENLRQMRQSTSIFRHIYQMFEVGSRQPGAPGGRLSAIRDDPQHLSGALTSGMLRGPDTTALAVRKFVTEDDFMSEAGESHVSQIRGQGVELETAGQPGQLPLSLNTAINTMEHRHKFALSHRCWLRFDAYSRVCMALGINHFLQALSYFIIGPVQQKRPSSSLITLISIQAIALLLLKLDLRNTEAEHDEEPTDNDNDSDSSKDGDKLVSQASNRDLVLTLSTYSLAPIWTTLALWANRFTDNKQLLSLSVSPCFFLHAMWLFLVLKTISPNQGDLLPVRLRTVGYLDIFTKDVLRRDSAAASESGAPGERGRGRAGSEIDRPLKTTSGLRWGGLKPGEKPHHHPSRSAESVPWLVVSRFVWTLICMWVCGGLAHFAHTLYPNFEEFSEDLEQEQLQELQFEQQDGEPRRLRAVWPEPAHFFEVTALHCNSSHVTFSSPSSLYAAMRHDDGLSLGALIESGSPGAHAVMCREAGGCDALVPKSGGSAIGGQTWQLETTGPAYYVGASNQTIQLPPEWRMATGAWLPCSPAPCEAALLGGWDGGRIVIADLRRASADDSWSLKRRFAVRPSSQQKRPCNAGLTHFSMATGSVAECNSTQAPDYTDVQAMHISVNSGCQTLMVLHNGTLDGWNLVGGAKLGSWSVRSTAHTAICHDGRDLIITHPGDQDGPVVEVVPLPSTLLNCTRAQAIGQDDIDLDLAKLTIAHQAGVHRQPL